MFSNRTNWNFSENKISLCLKKLKQKGVSILDLTESNPTHCHFKYCDAKLLAPFNHPRNLTYHPDPKGSKQARKEIQSYYQRKGIEVNIDHIFLTSSTTEAYDHIFRMLTNPGDRILVPKPSYPLFHFISDLNDLSIDHYDLHDQDDTWKIRCPEAEHLQALTKAIVLVNPNNPTGSFVKKDEAESLIHLAQSKSLALIADEVFLDYGFADDAKRVRSFAGNQTCLTFTLGGISKCLGLPQMKLSWMVISGPGKMVAQAIERMDVISDTFLSTNTPAQEALPEWFSFQNVIQNEIKERVMANQSWLRTKIVHPIKALNVEGGWNLVLTLPEKLSEEDWVLTFLEQDHVLVHPGYFFDFEDESHIVLSLLLEPALFRNGCERLLKRMFDKAE